MVVGRGSLGDAVSDKIVPMNNMATFEGHHPPMPFKAFVDAVQWRLDSYGLKQVPEQERPGERAGWKGPDKYAWLNHHPEDRQFPVRLGFVDVDSHGMGTTVTPQQSIPLKLDDYAASSAALQILRQFGIEDEPR